MADNIRLQAPTVEQQIVISISGEEKLRTLADTMEKISNGKNLQKYWKTQQQLIKDTTTAYSNFFKKASQGNAEELIKVTNALKAVSGKELSTILPDFDKIEKGLIDAKKIVGNIDGDFSVKAFKDAFESFEMLRAYGVDIENLFSHFGVSSNIGELQKNVRSLEEEVSKLTNRLSRAKDINEELRNEFENYKTGSGIADKLNELDNLKDELNSVREQAEETFRQFLKLNNISENGYDQYGNYDNNRFSKYFDNIRSGYLTASDAITTFKSEYAYLLEEGFKENNDTFGIERLQTFSNKLESIFRQVEETSKKINDIISNGVITKSVENLSTDSSLSNSQRSFFENILKDEDSLKNIESIIKRIIEESNNAPKIDLFNEEQLQQILPIFNNIESHLSSLRKIISDVGDGEEFSPLLKMINNVQSEINNLSEAVSNIKFNVNMDLGSEVSEKLNQKVAQSTSRQLEAYRKLFSAMKSTGKTNKEMFSFYEPEDASISDLIGLYKEMIVRAEKQFATTVKVNGRTVKSNAYKDRLGEEYLAYKKEVENATRQLSRAETKKSDSSIFKQLFGGGDLTEVISYLDKIVVKLKEISDAASKFSGIFENGFNVTASVEEIEKLTSRVRELEDELSKIKSTSIDSDVNKSNISSENSIVESQNKIQEELKETQRQAEETAKGIITVYRGLKSSSDEIFDTTHSSAWFSDNIESANSYARGIGDVYKSQIKIDNPMIVDANGANHERILYAETNEELQEAIKLQDELNSKRKEFADKYGKYLETQDMSLLDNPSEYLKASDALDELEVKLSKYLKTTEQLQEIAKNGGYDGLIIRNVEDNFIASDYNIGTSYAIFDKEKLIAYERIDYLKELEKQANSTSEAEKNLSNTPMKDVFQGETSSAEKLEEEIKNVTSATEKASESAKEYGKVLSQVGLAGMQFDDEGNQIPSKYSYTRQTGKNQVQTITIKYEQDEESGEIVQREYIGEYITGFQALEKEIDKADKKVYELKKNLASNKAKFGDNYDSSALESLVANAENEANMLYEALKKVYDEQSEYEYSIAQYAEERVKKQEEYNTQLKNSKNIEDARAKNASDKKNESDEKKRLANIEQVNRALNKQQIAIDSIEKTYNKSVNPDLDREVSNQQDLVELANKKAQIQSKINSLQGQERTSANEKEFLELEKLIAEYKELAKYKLKSNNPSKQELGGQNLQTLIQTQISLYDKLIIKAEQYGEETSDVVSKLKEQREILSKIDSTGKYTATADQYYTSRDTYKVEKAGLSAYEAEVKVVEKQRKAAEQQQKAIKAAREAAEKRAKINRATNQSETDKAAKEQLSAYEKIKKLKFEISKTTDADTLSSLKSQLKIEQDRYLNAAKILKANSDYFDKDAQDLKITQARLEAEEKIAKYKADQRETQEKQQQKAIESARKEALSKSESEQKAKQSETDKALKDQLNAYKKIQEIKYKLSYTEDDGERSKLLERQKLYQEEFSNAGKILSANSELYSIEQQTNELTKVRLEYEEKIAKYKADQRENQLSSIQKSIKSYNNDYSSRINGKPVEKNRSQEYQQLLDKYKASIDALQAKKDELSKQPTISEADLDSVRKMTEAVEENKNALMAMSAAEKGSSEGSRRKEIDKITKYLKDNTRISEEAKTKLKEYLDLLRNGGADVNVDEIHSGFLKVTEAERLAGNEGKRFIDIIRDKTVYGLAAQIASYYLSLMDMVRYARNAVNAVRELDTALIDLKKTTTMNDSELETFYYDANDVAKQMGVTTAEIINQASAWSRLGYSTKDASTEMAELSSQFASISPDMDLDTATDGLVSSMKAFGIEVTDVEREIMDNINRIGNTAATSNGEIVDMLTRSSAAMAAANNTIQETIALETAAVEITRNAETTGMKSAA